MKRIVRVIDLKLRVTAFAKVNGKKIDRISFKGEKATFYYTERGEQKSFEKFLYNTVEVEY